MKSNIKKPRKKKREKIDYKRNFSEYWSFLKKHRGYAFLMVFFITVAELIMISERFLFKIIIDDGTKFVNGVLDEIAKNEI